MKRADVTFSEFESGSITEKVSSLDDIKAGEGFICVRIGYPVGPQQRWPVWEKAEKGLFRQRGKEGVDHIREDSYDFFRVKE